MKTLRQYIKEQKENDSDRIQYIILYAEPKTVNNVSIKEGGFLW